MTGEQIYIPNIKLLAKTIKRLSARRFQGSWNRIAHGEKGLMIYFLCTLDYDHKLEDIRICFVELFEDENRKVFENHLENTKYRVPIAELDYVFSKELSCPSVFIEEFTTEGIVYMFSFYVGDGFLAPVFRSFFMERFKEQMDIAGLQIK